MRVSSTGGTVRVKLSALEASMLAAMLAELVQTLQADTDGPVRQRLYPDAVPDDAEATRAFRDLTEQSLQQERVERAQTCGAEVTGAGRGLLRGVDIELDADGADRWMRVLNDLRLVMGTELDIRDDDDFGLHRGDPDLQRRARYLWLTGLQDTLVQTVMG